MMMIIFLEVETEILNIFQKGFALKRGKTVICNILVWLLICLARCVL